MYLLDRADAVGIDSSQARRQVALAEEELTSGFARVNATTYELHHLLHLSMKSGSVSRVERNLGRIATHNISTVGAPTVSSIRGESQQKDDIFIELILPEYRATTPGEPQIERPDPEAYSRTKDQIGQALNTLRHADDYSSQEVDALVDRFTVLKSDSIKAGTSIRSFGRIWLEQASPSDNWFTALEVIVHELAHLHLYVLQLSDPMLHNGADDGFTSPFRPDPRPLSGIYHAMFVLGRSVEVLRRVARAAPRDSSPTAAYMNEVVEDLRRKFWDLEPIISEAADLSDFGSQIFSRCREVIQGAV